MLGDCDHSLQASSEEWLGVTGPTDTPLRGCWSQSALGAVQEAFPSPLLGPA